MAQRDVFNGVPTYVLPSTTGALGEVLTVGPPATPNTLVWAANGSAGGIDTINNIAEDATGNFTLVAGAGITLSPLLAGISISQNAAPVTEMNGIFPLAGTIDIAVGAGLTILNSGNTITLDTAAVPAAVPGFTYSNDGTLTLVGNGDIPAVNAPFTLYYSGVAPNQIATLQIGQASATTIGATPQNIVWFQQLPFFPKYLQAGYALATSNGVNFAFSYTLDTSGIITIGIQGPTFPVSGDTIQLYGISITFPIAP